jgi:SET family sugar efflux transporter-like MFS transporter
VPLSPTRVGAVSVAFVAVQATNVVLTSVMTLFVVKSMHLPALWGGIALGVAALAEIPALFALGRLSNRFAPATLLATGSLAGVAFYVVMAFAHDPATLVAAQLLNAWFFSTISGVGLTWFQDIIPRPGLASGLFTNIRRIGAIAAGGLIGIAGTAVGYTGMFLVCAGLTALALLVILAVRGRRSRRA